MHIPDGFLDGTTAAGTAVISAGGLGYAVRRAGRFLQDKRIALTGLVAAFIFALQMLNFPVAAGTSGHLLGGALAAILVGPWLGMTAVGVVIIVQALIFADGGITALGANILNMAIVTAMVGWILFRLLMRVLPKTWPFALVATFAASLVSVVSASILFVIEYAVGGQGAADIGTVFGAMVGVHFLIGLGEGLISAATIGAVAAVRPELIAGLEGFNMPAANRSKVRSGVLGFALTGMAVAAILVFLAPFASSQPDGLTRVAIDQGFGDQEQTSASAGSPLAGYGVSGVEEEDNGTRIAGLVGIGVTFLVGAGIVWGFSALRKRSASPL